MAKPKKKRRQTHGRRPIETALPKRQYKRINRLLYVFSATLVVVFGGGALLLGAGAPKGPTAPGASATQSPAIAEIVKGSQTEQAQEFTATPVPATATPTP